MESWKSILKKDQLRRPLKIHEDKKIINNPLVGGSNKQLPNLGAQTGGRGPNCTDPTALWTTGLTNR